MFPPEMRNFLYDRFKILAKLVIKFYHFILCQEKFFIDIDNDWQWNRKLSYKRLFDRSDTDLCRSRYKYLSYINSQINEANFNKFLEKYSASNNWTLDRNIFDKNLYYIYNYIKKAYDAGSSGIIYLYSVEAIEQVKFDMKLMDVDVSSFIFDKSNTSSMYISSNDPLKMLDSSKPKWVIVNDLCKCSSLLSYKERVDLNAFEQKVQNVIYVKDFDFDSKGNIKNKYINI